MIFVTVGEQLPFNRLVEAVDQWAGISGEDVFAQIGSTGWRPLYIKYNNFLNPEEFKKKCQAADIIVSHAGMGTIITALELGKPIIVMPRQSLLNEHRNDHQFATANRFLSINGVMVALDVDQLKEKLDTLSELNLSMPAKNSIAVEPLLIEAIRNFVMD